MARPFALRAADCPIAATGSPRWEQQSPEDQAAEIAGTPLRRIAEAPDQAKVICFLASADADFVTGVTIDVTGGN